MRPCVTGTVLSLAVVLCVVAESSLLSGRWHHAQTIGSLIAAVVALLLVVMVRRASSGPRVLR